MYTHTHTTQTFLVKENQIPKIGWELFMMNITTPHHRNMSFRLYLYIGTSRLGLTFRTAMEVIIPKVTKFKPSWARLWQQEFKAQLVLALWHQVGILPLWYIHTAKVVAGPVFLFGQVRENKWPLRWGDIIEEEQKEGILQL